MPVQSMERRHYRVPCHSGLYRIADEQGWRLGSFRTLGIKTHQTKIGAQIATIILGILIFIDDYFNCLTVGSVMRPITVRHGVTKEKLAYLIDSTAAPVCIISPISSWAAAVSGFVSGGENGLALFCQAIPFNFYAFFTIIFMFMIVVSGFDFKAMSKYDVRLQEWYERTGGLVDEVIDTKLHIVEHGVGAKQDNKKPTTTNGSVVDLVVPILMLIVFCMAGMLYSGGYFDTTSDCHHNFVDAFAASNASVGLVIGSLAALILTITMFVVRRTLKFDNAMSCLIKGFEAMVPAVLILTLAWTLKSMTDSLGAAEYVSGVVASSASGLQMLLPAIIFIVAALLAFATGTSWGTFGILIPICIAVFPAAAPLRIIPYRHVWQVQFAAITSHRYPTQPLWHRQVLNASTYIMCHRSCRTP